MLSHVGEIFLFTLISSMISCVSGMRFKYPWSQGQDKLHMDFEGTFDVNGNPVQPGFFSGLGSRMNAGGVVDGFIFFLTNSFNSLIAFITGIFTTVWGYVSGILTTVWGYITAVFNFIMSCIPDWLKNAVTYPITLIVSLPGVNMIPTSGLIYNIGLFLISAFAIVHVFKRFFGLDVVGMFLDGFWKVVGKIQAIFSTVINFLQDNIPFLRPVFTKIGELVGFVLGLCMKVWNFGCDIVGKIWGFILLCWNKVWEVVLQPIWNVILMVWNKVSEYIVQPVWSFILLCWNKLTGFLTAVWTKLTSFMPNLNFGIMDKLGNLFTTIFGFFAMIFNAITGCFRNTWNRIRGFFMREGKAASYGSDGEYEELSSGQHDAQDSPSEGQRKSKNKKKNQQ